MAIRRLEIPGKLITTALAVDLGPTGEFAVDSSDDAGITQIVENITGAQNTNQFTLSTWMLFPDSVSNGNLFFVESDETNPELNILITSQEIRVVGSAEGSNTNVVFAQSTDANLVADVWYHLLISVDNTLSASDATTIYLNDTKLSLSLEAATGSPLGIGKAESWWFLANERSSFVSLSSNICFSGFWFDIDRWVDLDVEANRRKFANAAGRPIALGTSGDKPFGESPILYFDNPVATWNVNRGSGGNFRFISGNDLDTNDWTACDTTPDTGTLG